MPFVVLANSKRPDGHCLAGIDLDTGQWVCPRAIRRRRNSHDKMLHWQPFYALRDILELDLIQPRTIVEFQSENRIIRNWNWRFKGRLNLLAIEPYIENTAPILNTLPTA